MYEVIRKSDGAAVSKPCSLRIAEGIRDYLESHTNETYLIVDVTPVAALYTNILSDTYPPISGGSPDMDADETACGQLCQDLNDRMWAKLGPVDDVELPF